jgi:hypothetical protein
METNSTSVLSQPAPLTSLFPASIVIPAPANTPAIRVSKRRKTPAKPRTTGVYTYPRDNQTTVVVKFIGSHRWQAWETLPGGNGLPIGPTAEYPNLKDARADYGV